MPADCENGRCSRCRTRARSQGEKLCNELIERPVDPRATLVCRVRHEPRERRHSAGAALGGETISAQCVLPGNARA